MARFKGERMSVLRANLGLFWECSSLWILSAISLSILLVFQFFNLGGAFSEAILFRVAVGVVLPVSQIVAAMQVDILSCPFALTLPRHQRIVRQVVFTVGISISLVATATVLRDIVLADHFMLSLSATISACLAVYFVGASLTYFFALPGLTIATFGWIVGFLGFNGGVDVVVTRAISGSPIPIIAAGVLSVGLAWLCLGRPPWRLRTGSLSRKRLRRQWNPRRAEGTTAPDSAPRGSMPDLRRTRKCLSGARHIWETLYASCAAGGGGRRQLATTLASALACAAVARYSVEMGVMFIMIGPFDRITECPLYSDLLFTRGRRERFFTTLTALMVMGCIWMISVVLAFAALDFVQPYLPQIRAASADPESGVSPANLRLAVFLTAFYPMRALVDLVFHDRPQQRRTAYSLLLVFVAAPVSLTLGWLKDVPLLCVAFAFTASWLVCAVALHRIAMRRDLVSARPEKEDWSWLATRHRIQNLQERGWR